MSRIELGVQVRDTITGFHGSATGRSEYISGPPRVLVEPKAKDDGSLIAAEWFDEPRLVEISADELAVP